MANLDWNPTAAVLWVILVGNIFNRLASLTSDQSIVQRYLTTPDEKQSRKSLWLDVAASIPWAVIVFGFGTVLYVFYKTHPESIHPAVDIDGVVPMFIAQQLPNGLSGLIIAAIFAAAMSSLDSAIHSAATVLINDGVSRFRPQLSEKRKLLLARIFTIALGVFATLSAILMISADIISLWDFFIKVVGLITGPMAGLFILGMFTRRTHGRGALAGMLISLLLMWSVKEYSRVHFFLYGGIGIVSCVIAGWLFSLILPAAKSRQGFDLDKI
jgi:Na+/proline symporter